MPDNAAQLHADGDACDTLNSMCVPIVFVPGVMGSRIDMPASQLAWDPDDSPAMLRWMTVQLNGRGSLQWNRSALSPSWSRANVFTTFYPKTKALDFLFGARKDIADQLGQLYSDQNVANAAPAPIDTYYARTRGWAGVAWAFYGPILLYLEGFFNRSGSHPVYAFGYDWRDSNAVTGAKLGAFISQLIASSGGTVQDVIVVTHSMGGLVLRGALVNDPNLDAKIRGVVHTVQPSNGAVACYRRFFTGAVAALDGGGLNRVLNNIMGNAPWEYAYLLSAAPGPLQLLPNHVFQSGNPWLEYPTGSLDVSDIYDVYPVYGWPGLQGSVDVGQSKCGSDDDIGSNRAVNDLLTNLAGAAEFHTNAATTAHRNTFALYSVGLTTDDHVRFLNTYPSDGSNWAPPQWSDGPWDIDLLHQGDGDGTVPRVSAACPTLTLAMPAEAFGKALEHSKVFADADFCTRTSEYVARLLTVFPGGSYSNGQSP